ncbi:hypothetical protein Tco_0755955 [Tanacetum coccineum]
MAALESCPKHNMIAYLEKTEGNVEFHEVIDFLRRSYIYHALTVSPVVSTTFVEQFWTSAKSKTINNVRHITAKVAGKFVSISEASIRTDLIFDDADGIDSLPNQAIFDAIQLMGYEGDLTVLTFNKALFSPQWRHLEAKKKFVRSAWVCIVLDNLEAKKTSLFSSDILVMMSITVRVKALYHKAQAAKLKPVIKHFKALSEDGFIGRKESPRRGHQRSIDAQKEKYPNKEEDYHKGDHQFNAILVSKVSTDEQIEGADDQVEGTEENNEEKEEIFESTEDQREGTEDKVSTDEQVEGTEAQSKEENASQASQTSTLTPTSDHFHFKTVLPKIDPKVQGKKKIEEGMNLKVNGDDILKAVMKFMQLEVMKSWHGKFQEVMGNRILAREKLLRAEREQFTIEERAKFLHDTIVAQESFLLNKDHEALRTDLQTESLKKSAMMTFLKLVGNFKFPG